MSLIHAIAAASDVDRYLHYRRRRDGDPFVMPFPGFGNVLCTGHPEGAQDIFRTDGALLEPPAPNRIEPLVGSASVILAGGERHRQARGLLMPSVHGARLHTYGAAIAAATEAELAQWEAGAEIDSHTASRAITLRVAHAVVLGDSADVRGYLPVAREFMESYNRLPMLAPAARRRLLGRGPWSRFLRARMELDRVLAAAVRSRRAAGGATDILGMLLQERYDDDTAPSDEDLVDQLRTLVVAGHETTATSVVWALYRLHREPAVLNRVCAEISAAGTDPTPDELARLPYLDAVCRETLRLHPPVPIVLRRVRHDAPPGAVAVRGVPVEPGSIMAVSIPLLHSEPTVWPDPAVFAPERWLHRKFTASEYAPFGGGHRRCVGYALAEFEVRVIIATLLRSCRMQLRPRDLYRKPPTSVPHNIATSPRRSIRFEITQLGRTHP